MTCCLMFRNDLAKHNSRFYRVEICANLFQEFSVLREWGRVGGKGQQIIRLFPDLLSASHAADRVRKANLRRGYLRA
ncbi:MAG: WGR domain-containing protein [Amylibacter sp.]|nr:WGR domain-containing protein [Amylibacter sp.]